MGITLPRECLDNILQHCSRLVLKKVRQADAKRGSLHDAATSVLFKELDLRGDDDAPFYQPDLSTCPRVIRANVRHLGLELFPFVAHDEDFTQDMQTLVAVETFPNLTRLSISVACRRPEDFEGYDEEEEVIPALPSQVYTGYLSAFSYIERLVRNSSLSLSLSFNLADRWSIGCIRAATESGCSPDSLSLQPNCMDCDMGVLDVIIEAEDKFVPSTRWSPRELELDTTADLTFLSTLIDHRNLASLKFGNYVAKAEIIAIPWFSACLPSIQSLTLAADRDVYLDASVAHLLQNARFTEIQHLEVTWRQPSSLPMLTAGTLTSITATVFSVSQLIESLWDILRMDLPRLSWVEMDVSEPGEKTMTGQALSEEMDKIQAVLESRNIILDIHLDWNAKSPLFGQDSLSLASLVWSFAPVLKTLGMRVTPNTTPALSHTKISLPRLEEVRFSCEQGKATTWIFDFLAAMSAHNLHTIDYSFVSKRSPATFFAGLRSLLASSSFPGLQELDGCVDETSTPRAQRATLSMCASMHQLRELYGIEGEDALLG